MNESKRKRLQTQLEESLYPENTTNEEVPAQQTAPGPKRTILIVDDEQSHREFASTILQEEGFRTFLASSVDESISLLQSHSDISLVLLDLAMPVQNGFVLLDFLRTNLRFRHIPTIVISANSNLKIVKKTTNYNISNFISKPFMASKLISAIDEVSANEWNKILIITEKQMIGNILSNIITRGGYKPITTTSGSNALHYLRSETIHAIVCDLILEDMAGLQLLEEVNETFPEIPIIFFTEQGSKITESDVVSAGGHGLIKIPFNNVELLHRLRSFKLSRNRRSFGNNSPMST